MSCYAMEYIRSNLQECLEFLNDTEFFAQNDVSYYVILVSFNNSQYNMLKSFYNYFKEAKRFLKEMQKFEK